LKKKLCAETDKRRKTDNPKIFSLYNIVFVYLLVTPADGLGSALALPIMGKGKAEAYEIAQARP
jgi:hypothetical protein